MENVEKKKMSKSTIIIIIVAAVILFFTIMAVGGIFTLNKLGIIHISFGKDAYEAKKADDEARNFVNALMKEDNNKIFKCIDVPESDFLSKDDIKNYLPKSSYQDIIGLKGKITSITLGSGTTSRTATVVISTGNLNQVSTKSVIVKCNLMDNNRWKVDLSDVYVKNWKISVPGGSSIEIDGKKVEEKYKTETKDLNDIYTIPAIVKSEKEIKVSTTNFGEETQKITPSSSSSAKTIQISPNEDVIKSAYEFIKNTWNSMYKEYIAGSDISSVTKYFDTSVSNETIESCYKSGFNSLTKGSSGYKYVNYVMTNVVDSKNKKNYISSNDVITLNFGYTLNWNWEFGYANDLRTMNRYSSIALKKDGDSWKIYDVTDSKLFSYSSQYTKNF